MSASDDEWDAQPGASAVPSGFSPEHAARMIETFKYFLNASNDDGELADEFFTAADGEEGDDQVNFLSSAVTASRAAPAASQPACSSASDTGGSNRSQVAEDIDGKIVDDTTAKPKLPIICEERACTPCAAERNEDNMVNAVLHASECSTEPVFEEKLYQTAPAIVRSDNDDGVKASSPIYYREYVYPKTSLNFGDDTCLSSDENWSSSSEDSLDPPSAKRHSSLDAKKSRFPAGLAGNENSVVRQFSHESNNADESQQPALEEDAEEEELIAPDFVEDNAIHSEESDVVEKLEMDGLTVSTSPPESGDPNKATKNEEMADAGGTELNTATIQKLDDTTPMKSANDASVSGGASHAAVQQRRSSPANAERPRNKNVWLPKSSAVKSPDTKALISNDDVFNSFMLGTGDSTTESLCGNDDFVIEDGEQCNFMQNHTRVEASKKSTAVPEPVAAKDDEPTPSWLPEKTAASSSRTTHGAASNASSAWGFEDDPSPSAAKSASTALKNSKLHRINNRNEPFSRPMTTPGVHFREAEHTANNIRSILDSLSAAEKADLQNATNTLPINSIDELIADIRAKPITEFSQLASADDAAMQNLIDTLDDYFKQVDRAEKARPHKFFQQLALPALLHPTRPNVLLVQRNSAGKTFSFTLCMCLRVAQYKLAVQRQHSRAYAFGRKPILQHTNATSSPSAMLSNDLCELCKKARADGRYDWNSILKDQHVRHHDGEGSDAENDVSEIENESGGSSGARSNFGAKPKRTKRFNKNNACPPIEPRVVVICPTRELVDQIYTDARKLCRQWLPCVYIVKTYGGQSYHVLRRMVAHVKGCVDILICTLGRLQDDPNLSSICFSRCTMLVCDDIDHLTGSMRSTKEYAEFLLRIELDRARRIKANDSQQPVLPDDKLQIVLATATNTPECISKARVQMQNVGVIVGAPVMPQPVVPHRVVIAQDPQHKKNVLGELVTHIFSDNADAKVLIFVNLRSMLNDVRCMLVSYSPLFRVLMPEEAAAGKARDELYDCIETIQGGMRACDRADVFKGFVNGRTVATTADADGVQKAASRLKILISTDVMCRGIDIPDITHVINFNLPQLVEVFTNRLGRCGRLGNAAEAYTIFQLNSRQDERALLGLMPIMRNMLPTKEEMPRELETVFAHALSHYRGGGSTKMQVQEGDVEIDTSAEAENRWRVERELELFEQICDDPQYTAKQVILNMGFWL